MTEMQLIETVRHRLRVHSRSEVFAAESIPVGDRVLIPVLEITANLLAGGYLGWAEMSVKAVITVDSDGEQALSLTEVDQKLEMLLKEVPELTTKIEQARKRLRSYEVF
jgi:uncharacterized spore protein YtfJ